MCESKEVGRQGVMTEDVVVREQRGRETGCFDSGCCCEKVSRLEIEKLHQTRKEKTREKYTQVGCGNKSR